MPTTAFRPLLVIIAALGLALTACAGSARTRADEWRPGVPKRTGQVVDGRQQGTWTYWYEDGAKQAEGGFRDDRQEGAWTWWRRDGSVEQHGSYAGGLRIGPWTFLHADGTLRAAGYYGVPPAAEGEPWRALDRQHGFWRYWHPGGIPAASGWFDAGRKTLVWTVSDERGRRLEQGAFRNGIKVGPWFEQGDAGGRLVDHGCPDGYQCYREPRDGRPTRWGMLQDQRPTGLWLAFHADGSARAASITDAAGERWMAWLPDGSLIAVGERSDQTEVESWLHPEGVAVDEARREERERLVAAARQALHAPLTAAPVPAPVAVPTAPAGALARRTLSPLPTLPGFWTAREETAARTLIASYAVGARADDGGYAWSAPAAQPADRERSDLLGKPLPQTRLLGPAGEVIDLADRAAAGRSCLLVVLRGFSGQVCIYCATQTAAIADNLARFAAAGTDVVLLYPGPAESVPLFMAAVRSLGRELPPRLTLAIDPDLLLVRRLGLEDRLARPTSLLLDRRGIVRWSYMGAADDDRPAVDAVLDQIARLP